VIGNDKKRKREDGPVEGEIEGAATKKLKSEEDQKQSTDDATITVDNSADQKSQEKEKKVVKNLDPHLTQAFHYFDRRQAGYLKDTDLETLLFSLGIRASRSELKDLIETVWRPNQLRLYYESLLEMKQ